MEVMFCKRGHANGWTVSWSDASLNGTDLLLLNENYTKKSTKPIVD